MGFVCCTSERSERDPRSDQEKLLETHVKNFIKFNVIYK